ncbi:MAG: polysaccharide deacetylase family protein, partial [Hyphomonadaceae bacterium]|nr:polysaccharide deacetylase family protein [Clostridia bacterium]
MTIAVVILFFLGLLSINSGLMQGIVSGTGVNRDLPIYCVDRPDKTISFSFDAAWGNEDTSTLIDILNKYNIKTTFFVVGSWVDKFPDSVRQLSTAGH